jgi:hypothetical protein
MRSATDRYTASRVLYSLDGLKLIGAMMPPGSDFVDAQHGALGEGEEPRRPAQSPFLQSDAAGRLARGGLRRVVGAPSAPRPAGGLPWRR